MCQISSWPGNLRRLQASSAKAYTTKDLYLGYSLVGPAGLFKHHHTFAVICSNLFDDVWWFVACHCCNFTAKYSGQEVTESWRPNLWVKSQGQLSWVGQVGPIHGSSTVFLGKSFCNRPGWSNLLEKRQVSWNSAMRQMRCNLAKDLSKPAMCMFSPV